MMEEGEAWGHKRHFKMKADLDRAQEEGAQAYHKGTPLHGNPYTGKAKQRWVQGWHNEALAALDTEE